MDDKNILTQLGFTIIAILGSLVSFLNSKDKSPKKFASLLVQTATSGFIGLLIFYAAQGLNVDLGLGFAISGMGGFLGMKGLNAVAKNLLERVTKIKEDKK